MRIVFLSQGWEDYEYWRTTDPRLTKKVSGLIRECTRTPFAGTGKPELLGRDFAGWWSRRIDGEHRLVYRIVDDDLIIAQCRYHYSK